MSVFECNSRATEQVIAWLANFNDALLAGDVDRVLAGFEQECYWRDLVAFTWNIVTLEGQESVREMLDENLASVQPKEWQIEEGEASENDGVVEAVIRFDTACSRGNGYIRLRDGKCWTLLTSMTELKGFEEKSGCNRLEGAHHGVFKNRKSWLELKEQEEAELGYRNQPYCLIIGGGQGGIALGARLRQLEVPTIIIEKHARVGDSWRSRYKSLCLHDPVWYDHLPYIPFPKNWPVFSPKDKIGDWLEMYTKVMELNYWHSTICKQAHFDEARQEWSVQLERAGVPLTLRPKQLVIATGMSGMPNIPRFIGAENFKGEQHHSSRHSGDGDYKGKRCVVVGANNSAHDIAADLWERGAEVTMVQRSTTMVARSETLMEMGLKAFYSEEALSRGMTTEKADLISASMPFKEVGKAQIALTEAIAEKDAALYSGLRKVGFYLDFGDDGTGLWMKYLRRGSGYYIDVGASQLIIDGKIKLKSNVNVDHIKEDSVVFTDGTELTVDLIIYATGYGPMSDWAAKLISQEVADKVGKCWGLGSDTTYDPGPWEGELRNMWKPTLQNALWFHGGNLYQSRYYSLPLALQLKARFEGIETPVYALEVK